LLALLTLVLSVLCFALQLIVVIENMKTIAIKLIFENIILSR